MKRVYTLCVITCLVMSLFSFGIHKITREVIMHNVYTLFILSALLLLLHITVLHR